MSTRRVLVQWHDLPVLIWFTALRVQKGEGPYKE